MSSESIAISASNAGGSANRARVNSLGQHAVAEHELAGEGIVLLVEGAAGGDDAQAHG